MVSTLTPKHVRTRIPGVVYPSQDHLDKYCSLGVLGLKTLPDVFREVAQAHSEKPAIIGDLGELTHAELDEQTDRLAAALLELGLAALDPVVMHVGDSPELLIAFIASIKAGLIPICTLAAHREQEIGQIASQAGARLIITQSDSRKFDHVDFAERMCQAVPTMKKIVLTGTGTQHRHPTLGALIDSMSLERARQILAGVVHDPFQVAVYQLSGGTSGTPKIIPRFHNEYLYNMQESAEVLGLEGDERLYMPTPMMHNLHVVCGWGPVLIKGGALIIPADISGDAVARSLASGMPTRLCLPPPLLARAKQSSHWSNESLGQVRGMISPFNARQLTEELGVPVYHVFGMTEGVIMYTRETDSETARFETVGRPISEYDEIRILKPDTDIEQDLGEPGELAIRGPYTLFGYFDAPERNEEAFTSDGLYRSGDLMRAVEIDGKRYYQFCGRLKDVVDRAGEKINAEEVERAVMRHGAFVAALVVGAPDPVFTERVCVAVVPRPNAEIPDIAALGRHLQEMGLAKFKWPERIEVIETVPLTHSGKPDKAALKRQLFGNQEHRS